MIDGVVIPAHLEMFEDYLLVPDVVSSVADARRALAGSWISELMGEELFQAYEQLGGKDHVVTAA